MFSIAMFIISSNLIYPVYQPVPQVKPKTHYVDSWTARQERLGRTHMIELEEWEPGQPYNVYEDATGVHKTYEEIPDQPEFVVDPGTLDIFIAVDSGELVSIGLGDN